MKIKTTIPDIISKIALSGDKTIPLLLFILVAVSALSFVLFSVSDLALKYNDARSHLDIGRRVVEGLKPGLAQLGSVWLPLPHLLMIPTIWDDFFWHTGLSGAIQSMISYVATGLLIYLFLKRLGVSMFGRLLGTFVFAVNINILYLQSTAMTELLLLATMTAGAYELLRWEEKDELVYLVRASFWIMLSTLVRYDGWFLFAYATLAILIITFKRAGYKAAEGKVLMFCTLGGIGIIFWFVWNLLIFNDPLYFALGPFSAHEQQAQLEKAGDLLTKGDLLLSIKVYFYALAYNANAFVLILGIIGGLLLAFDRKIKMTRKIVISALLAPFIFNVLALFLGHSVLFVQGITGNSWFNVRYGTMMIPSIAIFTGYLASRIRSQKILMTGLILFITFFSYLNMDAATIDDALVGASGKNVAEVSSWLKENAGDEEGFILISAASHDAIIFSSGLPMGRFIHEGTGEYWDEAIENPESWARWIIMRTGDNTDLTFQAISNRPGFENYELVEKYPFADIYRIKPGLVSQLQTAPDSSMNR